ncbi:MAG: hypothetical protein JXJ04_16470 [Spirochaetales bacterium]|nr:hypothetical protein [Spirochaetales bacterium]
MDNNKEYETLQIKKDSDRELVYHYQRKKRPGDNDKTKGIKRLFRNKGLLIIVCDIILITLIYFFIRSPLFDTKKETPPASIKIDNYYFTLHGYRIKDKVFARLYIENWGEWENEAVSRVRVRFSLGDEVVDLLANLPSRDKEEVKVPATLLCPDNNTELTASVTLGEKTESLTVIPLER